MTKWAAGFAHGQNNLDGGVRVMPSGYPEGRTKLSEAGLPVIRLTKGVYFDLRDIHVIIRQPFLHDYILNRTRRECANAKPFERFGPIV